MGFFCCRFFTGITEGHSIGQKLTQIYANDLEERIDCQSNFEKLHEVMRFRKSFSVMHQKGFEVFLDALLSAKADIVRNRLFAFPS